MSEKKYGNLLDRERQRGADEGKNRYGDLLKNVNPHKCLDAIVSVEQSRNRRRLEEAEEDRRSRAERQRRIEDEERERDERVSRNNAFVGGFLEKKRNEQERKDREREKQAEEKKLLDSIGRLMDAAPNAADAYVDVMVKLGK